jgi:histidine triad (HIT) family protein
MDCIFCKIARGEIPSQILHQDDELTAFRDIRPQAPTHVQIIPKRHIDTILDLGLADERLIGKMVLLANRLAQKEGLADNGYRLVFNCKSYGGQEVYHIHLHLLGGRRMAWPPG